MSGAHAPRASGKPLGSQPLLGGARSAGRTAAHLDSCVHVGQWLIQDLDHPGGYAHRDRVRRDVSHHDRPGTDLAALPHRHRAQDRGPGAQQRAVADGGVPLPQPVAAAAERDVVQHRDVIADDGRLSNHDAGRMVHQHAAPQLCGGVDVHCAAGKGGQARQCELQGPA